MSNSSSSSFILAQRGAFSEKQKEAILKYAVKKLLGKSKLTPESTEEDVRKVFNDYSVDDEYQEQIRQALVEGKAFDSVTSVLNAVRTPTSTCLQSCGRH